jgi:hypothetical protein
MKTVTVGGNNLPVKFTFWRGRSGLRIRSDVVGSGRKPLNNVYPMPIRKARTTMEAGISIHYEPDRQARLLQAS